MITYIQTQVGNLWEIEKVEFPYIWLVGSDHKIHCDYVCEPGWFYGGKVYSPEALKELNIIPNREPLTETTLQEFQKQIEFIDISPEGFRIIDSGSWVSQHKMDTRTAIYLHNYTGAFLSVSQDRSGDDWKGYEYSEISVKQVFKSYELKEVYKDSL